MDNFLVYIEKINDSSITGSTAFEVAAAEIVNVVEPIKDVDHEKYVAVQKSSINHSFLMLKDAEYVLSLSLNRNLYDEWINIHKKNSSKISDIYEESGRDFGKFIYLLKKFHYSHGSSYGFINARVDFPLHNKQILCQLHHQFKNTLIKKFNFNRK